MPESIPAPHFVEALKETFREARLALAAEGFCEAAPGYLGWVVSVPDTHQKTVLAALDKERTIRVLTCAMEDEANAVAAGLYASVNTLGGVAIDGHVPIFYTIGLLGRERDKDPSESRSSMVRYCEPLLNTFGVPHARLEGPEDLHLIPEYYRLSRQRRGPAAVLAGLETG